MKKIGLIGGISWSSTVDYYRIVNEAVNRRLGGLHFAECIIYSVNFDDFRNCNVRHDWDGSHRLLSHAALQLRHAGAECIVLCANTAHIVAERIQESVGLPLIDIRAATAQAIQQQQLSRVELLGTVFTMELDFYREYLMRYGIETIVPANQADRAFIEHTLLHELGKGLIIGDTKSKYIQIAQQLIQQGAEGVILGCTEIPLLLQQEDFNVPVFNTTRIHAEAAVAFALGEQ